MRICFVFTGPLEYRGRLFKQIRTLQDEGIHCMLVHGWTEDKMPDYSIYSFPVVPIRVLWERSKILTLTSMFRFNSLASKAIIRSGVSAVVCIGLESALAGGLAKKKSNALKFIYDSNELSLEMYTSKIKRRIMAAVQNFAIKHANVIIHAERNRLEYFNKTYPNIATAHLLENLPYYLPESRQPPQQCKKFVYLGIISPRRYIDELVDAFTEWNSGDFMLDIIGFGRKAYVQKIKDKCAASLASNVRILPSIPHEQIYEHLKNYDAGFAFYRNTDINHYYCAPNKVYDYIQMKMPVITNDFPGLVEIVQMNRIGVCISNVDAVGIRNAISRINEDRLFENISESIRRRYSWENQRNAYLSLFTPGMMEIADEIN